MRASDRTRLPPSPCTATALRKASRRISSLYDEALRETGLKATQFAILAALGRRRGTPPTMRDLAEAMVMDRSSLGHNLRPLERDGLVAIEGSPEDRRRRHVVLTEKGAALLERGRAGWSIAQARFDTVYGAGEAATLRATLLGIAENRRLARLAD